MMDGWIVSTKQDKGKSPFLKARRSEPLAGKKRKGAVGFI